VLKNREYTLSVIGSMLLYLVMMGSSIILPLYVQSIMGCSATVSGLVTLPGSLIMAVISPFAGIIYDKLGMKILFIVGAVCMLFSNLGMVFIGMDTPLWIPSVLNAIRCASIGCLMMPFVTWGTSGVKNSTAHATALLTSLRTIAGAIGSAVFVGIMTAVATGSKNTYGSNAQIHGLNVTFGVMSLVTTVLLLIAVFCVKGKKHKA
jgi:MFS family permease